MNAPDIKTNAIELLAVTDKASNVTRWYASKGEGFKRVSREAQRYARILYARHSCFSTVSTKTHVRQYVTIQKD